MRSCGEADLIHLIHMILKLTLTLNMTFLPYLENDQIILIYYTFILSYQFDIRCVILIAEGTGRFPSFSVSVD